MTLFLAQAEEALDDGIAVRAVLPLACRTPVEAGAFRRRSQRFPSLQQCFDVDTVVDRRVGCGHSRTPSPQRHTDRHVTGRVMIGHRLHLGIVRRQGRSPGNGGGVMAEEHDLDGSGGRAPTPRRDRHAGFRRLGRDPRGGRMDARAVAP